MTVYIFNHRSSKPELRFTFSLVFHILLNNVRTGENQSQKNLMGFIRIQNK